MIFPRKVKVTFSSKFNEIKRPKVADTLMFPSDITELTSANVSDLHAQYTELYTYANQELAKANVAIIQLQTEEAFLRNKIFIESPRINQLERWRRDSLVEADPRLEAIHKSLVKFRVEKEFAQMAVTNYDKYINALSRELSRKAAEGKV
jgi:hypothetical protein